MKLTVKIEAKEKVRGFVRDFEDYGRINRPFDTKDFVELERAVILTIEEAKDFLGWLYNSKWKWEHQTDTEFAEDWRKDWIRYLNERIEQAEKGDDR